MEKGDILSNDDPCGGLEAYRKEVTVTNSFGWGGVKIGKIFEMF